MRRIALPGLSRRRPAFHNLTSLKRTQQALLDNRHFDRAHFPPIVISTGLTGRRKDGRYRRAGAAAACDIVRWRRCQDRAPRRGPRTAGRLLERALLRTRQAGSAVRLLFRLRHSGFRERLGQGTENRKFGDIARLLTPTSENRGACRQAIKNKIALCRQNTSFVSNMLDRKYPGCLPIFRQQTGGCADLLRSEAHKCQGAGSVRIENRTGFACT